jgi:hypothetical protein
MNPPTILQQLSRASKLSALAFAMVAIGVLASLLLALAAGSAAAKKGGSTAAPSTCVGKDVFPGQDITAVAKAAPAGTTFCIHDGSYSVSSNIVVQSGDTFTGLYSDVSRPQIKGTDVEYVFYTGGTNNATIRGLAVSGAIGGDYCEPSCGRGIGGGGSNLLIEDVRAYNNANQGAGALGSGTIVRDSRFDHNGSASFAEADGYRSSAGLKTVASIRVYNSEFVDNYWNGFWCDVECNATEVHDSVLSRNGKAGLHYEISSGPAVFEGNTIKDNGYLPTANRRAGLLIVSSANVEAYGNTFGGSAGYGIEVVEDDRPPALQNVSVHHNTMNGDPLSGCDRSGVTCNAN